MLYLLLSPSNPKTEPYYLFANEDKLIHFILFFSWVTLIIFGWEKIPKALVIFLMVMLAGGTEWIQQYVPRRSADIWDFVADSMGGGMAILVSFFVKRN